MELRSSPPESDDADPAVITVSGEYCYIENPCTTRPCLPGMVYALRTEDNYYYLSVQGHLVSESLSWRGFSPQTGEQVTASGRLSRQEDIFGKSYQKIELLSLKRCEERAT